MSSKYSRRFEQLMRDVNSNKALERKKSILELSELLENKEMFYEIDHNTENNESGLMNWACIIHTIHKFLINEADRVSKKEKTPKVIQDFESKCQIIIKVTRIANRHDIPLIKSSVLIPLILQVLKSNLYDFYHHTYIILLTTHVLPIRTYQIALTSEQWKELLQTLIQLYKYITIDVDKCNLLNGIQIIVQEGCSQSDLLFQVKKMFPFLESIFLDVFSGKNLLAIPAFKVAYSVCAAIAVHCRIAICDFSKKMLPRIISLNNSAEKYKFMLLLVQIHHPDGATLDEDVAHASEWNKWKKIIQSMYVIIMRDCKSEKLSESFLHFASEIFNQTLKVPEYSVEVKSNDDDPYSQPVKRRKVLGKLEKLTDLFKNITLEESWPIVQILTTLFSKYPDCLKPTEYTTFIKAMTNILFCLNVSTHENIMNSFYELLTVILHIEKQNLLFLEYWENVHEYWNKIWDIVLRSLSLNQNERTGHKLAQLLMHTNKIQNLDSLLKLYSSKTIKWSSNSVRTLMICCENTSLSNNASGFNINDNSILHRTDSFKKHLLKWVLNVPWQNIYKKGLLEDLCNTLMGIALKSETKDKSEDDLFTSCGCHDLYCAKLKAYMPNNEEILIKNIVDSYKSTTFDINLCVDTRKVTLIYNKNNITNTFFDEEILNYLKDYIFNIITGTENTHICSLIIKITFAAKFFTHLMNLKKISHEEEQNFIKIFGSSLKTAYALFVKYDFSKVIDSNLIQFARAFIMLYGTAYCSEIVNVIICLTSKDVLSKVYDWINCDDTTYKNSSILEPMSKKYPETDTEECQFNIHFSSTIRGQALIALTYFCHMAGTEQNEIQIKLMKKLLIIDIYENFSIIDFKMAMIVLLSVTENLPDDLEKNYGDTVIEFLAALCKYFHKDEYFARCILNILPRLFTYAHKCNFKPFLEILIMIRKRLEKNGYGHLVYAAYMKCYINIIEINHSFLQIKYYNEFKQATEQVFQVLLLNIANPYFIVRLEVAKCLQKLFALQTINIGLKGKIFVAFRDLKNDIDKTEMVEELQIRNITAFLTHAYIICNNGSYQNRSLFVLLQIVNRENVDFKIAQKLFRTIKKYVNNSNFLEDNINYLLYRWVTSSSSLDTIPWMLFECDSEEKFYKTYITNIVATHIINLDITSAMAICERVNLKFSEIFENVFPQVLPWMLQAIMEECEIDSEIQNNIKSMFQRLMSNEMEFSNIQNFHELLNKKFDEVIINIIKHLDDSKNFTHIFCQHIVFPITDPPPYYSKNSVDICLNFVEKNSFERNRPLQYTLFNLCPNMLQKILLKLTDNIYKTIFIDHRLKAFHQYTFFCSILIKDIGSDGFNSVYKYLIREISYTLLYLMKENNELLSEAASTYFKIFLDSVLPYKVTEIKKLLNYYVTSLIAIISEKHATKQKEIVLKILKFLIVEQKSLLRDAIQKLNSFHNNEIFKDIQEVYNELRNKQSTYNLEEKIQHFLNATNEKDIHCSPDSILHLKDQLSEYKIELQEIYNKLQIFYDMNNEPAHSIIHQLIYRLVKLIKSSNMENSIAAAKCLGELGPTDLMTMILYPRKGYFKESNEFSVEILCYKLLTMLAQFVISSEIELRKESAKALSIIASSTLTKPILNEKELKEIQKLTKDSDSFSIDYIKPFIGQSFRKEAIRVNSSRCIECFSSSNPIWSIRSNETYSKWIAATTCCILDCFFGCYLENLAPICKLNVKFCELLLPRIIFLITILDNKLDCVCNCINVFFEYHFQLSTNLNRSSLSLPTNLPSCSQETLNCMLDVTNFIRIQIGNEEFFNLKFMSIAMAAQHCSAFFTALFYAELMCEKLTQQSDNDFTTSTKIDYICEKYPEEGLLLQNILKDAYLKIGDPDAIHGCGSLDLKDPSSLVQYYTHTRKWDKVMLIQDIELHSDNHLANRNHVGMTNALRHSGLHYLLGHFLSGTTRETEKYYELEYECAWRLSNWNILNAHSVKSQNGLYSKYEFEYHVEHYKALKCLYEGNDIGVKTAVEKARLSIVKVLCSISLESSKTLYEKLAQLQMLQEIEEFNCVNLENFSEILNNWKQYNIANSNEFEYVEPILTQRTVMLKKHLLHNNSDIQHALISAYMDIAKVANDQEHSQIATLALGTLKKLAGLSVNIQNEIEYHDCLLLWNQNDYGVSSGLLKRLMHKSTLQPLLKAKILRTYGDWMVETKFENPQVIQEYYQDSINIINSVKDTVKETEKILYNTEIALAQFADLQYQQICEYMQSPSFESFKECVEYSRNVKLDKNTAEDHDLRIAVITSKKQHDNDIAELENIQKEKNKYLTLALKYYLKVLQISDDYNLLIFRVIALWLNNKCCDEVESILMSNLFLIPSYKYIPLIPQLAAHMHDKPDAFVFKIAEILERCSINHPHHTLPVLLALANLYEDYNYFDSKKPPEVEEPRILGCKKLINQLSKQADTGEIIKDMNKISEALVMLANYRTPEKQTTNRIKIHRNQKILRLSNLERAFVPTINVDVRPSSNYQNVVGIYKYENTYDSVGGKSAPKKVTCICTDGIKRTQLVKGVDDLRQDAVMQQVFGVMNTLLQNCKETKRRQLRIRTYKVVPLTQRSGVIEWCDNTIPIVTALIGSDTVSGLHKKYYPDDYDSRMCVKKMMSVENKPNELKLKMFIDCCNNMRPVFHHFFIEKYPSPEIWFKRRLAYTRSIATTSIAGYILGLGDRHLNNILIDETTAEVIHIDLGIAFEQGKVLRIPETVPFRLTREIVAPMGVAGVAGTMKRCCEETMTVLRDQKQIIITLLQVLQYDPLFAWDITPAKAYSIQSGAIKNPSGNDNYTAKTNKTAQRAILRVEQKLQGTEEGIATSVSGQVTRLIQEARDPSNLCRLFVGWRPFL
ncbi:serine-protein kinase ATM-like [Prorops nasuta]|uniref:serine-protein kinase ATM-like n=1 Tax=Prorops nasuta TaxID=863751 RepID=UPI0034D0068D